MFQILWEVSKHDTETQSERMWLINDAKRLAWHRVATSLQSAKKGGVISAQFGTYWIQMPGKHSRGNFDRHLDIRSREVEMEIIFKRLA